MGSYYRRGKHRWLLWLTNLVQLAASRSLATFGRDPAELGNVVIRLALASNTASSTALFRSLLALSSLHRYDDNPQAIELKVSALEALTATAGKHISTAEAIQHVATNMLLCSLEVGTLTGRRRAAVLMILFLDPPTIL